MIVHVENDILSHDSKPYQGDIGSESGVEISKLDIRITHLPKYIYLIFNYIHLIFTIIYLLNY